MLSKELESSLNQAFNEARDKRHEYITVEHLLLALLDNSSAKSVLQACGADLKLLASELREYLEKNTPVFGDVLGGEVQPTPAHLADGQPLAGDQRCDDECSLVAHTTGRVLVHHKGGNMMEV